MACRVEEETKIGQKQERISGLSENPERGTDPGHGMYGADRRCLLRRGGKANARFPAGEGGDLRQREYYQQCEKRRRSEHRRNAGHCGRCGCRHCCGGSSQGAPGDL